MSSINQTELSIQLSGKVATGTMVSVNFKALQGANPKKLGYFIAIWQGNQIMSLDQALQVQNLETTDVDGSVTFNDLGLNNKNYTIGFGVNNKNGTTVCATLAVPAGVPQFQPLVSTLSSVTLQIQESDSLIASYITPAYNLPATNKNWIALFKGNYTANMYTGQNVVKTAFVTSDTDKGGVSMNNIPGGMIRFESYTLVYGMGTDESGNPDFSNLISATEFNVA